MYKPINCSVCGVFVDRKSPSQKYCGNKKLKTGCAYVVVIETARKCKKNNFLRYYRFHQIWENMKQRCNNPNDYYYYNYGGRGIKICDRWSKYINFKADMEKSYKYHLKKYGKKNTTIDRINNNGNYCKENCKWSTLKEQNSNKRKPDTINRKRKENVLCPCGKIFYPPVRTSKYCSSPCYLNYGSGRITWGSSKEKK